MTAKAGYINARKNLLNKNEVYKLGGVSKSELKSSYSEFLSSMSRYYQSRKNYETNIIGFRNKDLKEAGIKVSAKKEERKKALVDHNTIIEKNQLKVARSSYQNAQLELKNIKMMLNEATVVSPLSGVVASRSIEVGEQIKPNEPIFVVVRMDKLLVSTTVPEKQVRYLKLEQNTELKVDALGEKILMGKVYQISPVIDVKTRTAEVKVLIDNSKMEMRPGMFARCSILVRTRKGVLALPEEAFVNRRKKDGRLMADIFVVQEGMSFKRSVALGEKFGDKTEILAGIKEGDVVARSHVQTLKDGGKVLLEQKKPVIENKSARNLAPAKKRKTKKRKR